MLGMRAESFRLGWRGMKEAPVEVEVENFKTKFESLYRSQLPTLPPPTSPLPSAAAKSHFELLKHSERLYSSVSRQRAIEPSSHRGKEPAESWQGGNRVSKDM